MATSADLYVRAGVEFVHDMAAGAFPGAVLGAWTIRRAFESTSPEAVPRLEIASAGLWLILLGALFLIVATGSVRLTYWKRNVRPGFMESKKQLVLVKHAAFVLLLVASTALAFRLVPA